MAVKDIRSDFSTFLVENGHASRKPPMPKLHDLKDGISRYLNIRCETVASSQNRTHLLKPMYVSPVHMSIMAGNSDTHDG